MSSQVEFLNRTAQRILLFAVILTVLRMLRSADSKPLVDVLAVAIPAGVGLSIAQLHRSGAVDPRTRRLAALLGLVGILCWAVGIWLERNAADQGAWIVVSGIVVIATLGVMEWIRSRAAPRATRAPADVSANSPDKPARTRLMTLPALGSTVAFIVVELVAVDWLGGLAAHRLVFDGGNLFPLTLLLCGGAGFVARRLSSSGAVAGALVTGVDAFVWSISGGITPEIAQGNPVAAVGIAAVLVGLLGGGIVGAIGGGLGARRERRTAPPSP
jgi:hypothetical protein